MSSAQCSLQVNTVSCENYSVGYDGGRVSFLVVFLRLVSELLQDTLAGRRVGLD